MIITYAQKKKKLLSTLGDSKIDWMCVFTIRLEQRDVTMWINEQI